MLNKMSFLLIGILAFAFFSCENTTKEKDVQYELKSKTEKGYTYQYVTNDPTNTRIYTLENGLKVYLSVNKNEPRIQSFIPVRAGGKFDPSDNTGLAHYLEHIMFKGTDDIGTKNWEMEKPLLDSIEMMFEHYKTLEKESEREAYYNKIDQVSVQAAEYALSSEYSRMIEGMGIKGLNAYTAEDRTVYMSDVPKNQLEKFLEIEQERFTMITPRLFHTELETVYEEKNRALDSDSRKAYETMKTSLFEGHPYGEQSVLGTIEHLKNPSIKAIKNYYNKYYVPNNMAICMTGDLDPTATIKLIDEHFGKLETKEIEDKQEYKLDSLNEIIEKEVWGPSKAFVRLGFRGPGRTHEDYPAFILTDMILSNRAAGLIDLNLKQKQKVLDPSCYPDVMNEHSMHVLYGTPREGQSLEEVKDLLLGQIEMVKNGEFEDWLIDAVIADLEKHRMKSWESNSQRAHDMVMAFTNDMSWADFVAEIDEMKKLTKEEIVQFANEYYQDNYTVVYKRNGEDPDKNQIEKPQITKLDLNREDKSDFYKMIENKEVSSIEPVFVDYEKDINKATTSNNIEVLTTLNQDNELFELYYVLDFGTNNNPMLETAVEYLEYLGTDSLEAEAFKKELYKLGCSFNVNASGDRVWVMLEGLDKNMEKAVVLFEDLLANPKEDQEALDKMVEGILKERKDIKKDKGRILWSGLLNYGRYGDENPFTNVVSNNGLKEIDPSDLTDLVKEINSYQHRVLYYGPKSAADIAGMLDTHHQTPEELKSVEVYEFPELEMTEPKVYWTHYDMVQTETIIMNKGDQFNKEVVPPANVFSEYFNNLAFQEIREAQGLAYSVFSRYYPASKKERSDLMLGYVGFQADKQPEALSSMMALMNDPPKSENEFNTAKDAVINNIETERIIKSNLLFNYLTAERRGLDYDLRKDIYNEAKQFTLDDIMQFHETHIKGEKFTFLVLGHKDKIDTENLRKYGDVKELSLEEIFGYGDVQVHPETETTAYKD